jgi:hypothetical protein
MTNKKAGYQRQPAQSGRRDSNPRPSAWQADALPAELLPLMALVEYANCAPSVNPSSPLFYREKADLGFRLTCLKIPQRDRKRHCKGASLLFGPKTKACLVGGQNT